MYVTDLYLMCKVWIMKNIYFRDITSIVILKKYDKTLFSFYGK